MAIPLQLNVNLKAKDHDCGADSELALQANNAISVGIPTFCGIPLKTLSYVVFMSSTAMV